MTIDLRRKRCTWSRAAVCLLYGLLYATSLVVTAHVAINASDTSTIATAAPRAATAGLEQVACGVDEILLASDGAIDRHTLQLGERVAPNRTLNGTVREDAYHFYHLCIVRHDHEHQINVNLSLAPRSHEDANLYLSSEETHPHVGHSAWIAQRPGSDFVKLYTYLDGFPRRSESHGSRTIALHIGVRGVSDVAHYNLTVSVLDLPETHDIQSRERFYTAQHERDRAHWGAGDRLAGGIVASDRKRRTLRRGGV